MHWNPLRAGKGPQCFVQVKNELDANESGKIKMTFREVKRRFFEAKAEQIVLETYK